MTQNESRELEDFTAPKHQADGFNCPHCGSFNQQDWYLSAKHFQNDGYGGNQHQEAYFSLAQCYRCKSYSLWISNEERMIYPLASVAPRPHKDMPKEILPDFNEAREIVSASPRGAAALLRLSAEKLAEMLVVRSGKNKGKDLNENIKILVADGLPPSIQKALDSLRVIGNESVHPGVLDLRDDRDTALRLFRLLNVIVDNRISQLQEIEELYEGKVPDSKKDAIQHRDSPSDESAP